MNAPSVGDRSVAAGPAIEELIHRHYALIHAACARQAPRNEVDDCVQAVFQVLLRRWSRACAAPSIEGWLVTVARHVCARARRAERTRRRHERAAAAHASPSGGVVGDIVTGISHHLDACLARLPERQRTVLTLLYLCGRSREEIAAGLGMREDAVRQLCHRGLRRMRELLRRAGVAVPDEAALSAALAAAKPALAPVAPPALASAISGALSPHAAGSIAAGAAVQAVLLAFAAVVVLGIAIAVPLLVGRTTAAPTPVPAVAADPPARADALVGKLADVAGWRITGASAFSPTAIIDALRWDLDVAYAMHPLAPRQPFLRTLRQRILDGYRHGGFAHASVSIDDRGDRLAIAIEEGARCVCGPIRVTGGTRSRELSDWLALGGPAPRQPGGLEPSSRSQEDGETFAMTTAAARDPAVPWVAGDPAPFDQQTTDAIQRSVEAFYRASSYVGTRASVRVVEDGDRRAALEVAIADVGHRPLLARIDIRGVDAPTAGVVRDLLATAPDAVVGPPLLASMRERLRATGRFSSIVVDTAAVAPDRQAVEVALVPVRASIPPLSQPLGDDERAAVRVAEAIERWGRGLDDRDGVGVMPLRGIGMLTVVISPSHRAVAAMLDADDPDACVGLALSAERVELFAPRARWSHRLDAHALATLTIALSTPAEYDERSERVHDLEWCKLDFHVGLESHRERGGFLTDVTVDPAMLCVLLHHPTFAVTHPGADRLVCASRDAVVELPTGGEHPLPTVRAPQGGFAWSFTQGAIDRLGRTGGMVDVSGTESLAAFVAMRQAPLLLDRFGYERAGRVVADLAASVARHLADGAPVGERLRGFLDGEFALPDAAGPADAATASKRGLALMQFGLVSAIYPGSSWVTRISRELFLSTGDHGDHLDDAIAGLHDDPAVGPLACLLMGRLLDAIGHPDAARRCAAIGSARLDQDHWDRDVDLLEPFAGPVADVVGDLEHPEDAVALAIGHADGEAVAAARALGDRSGDRGARLRVLGCIVWEHGLRERLRDALVRLGAGMDGGF